MTSKAYSEVEVGDKVVRSDGVVVEVVKIVRFPQFNEFKSADPAVSAFCMVGSRIETK